MVAEPILRHQHLWPLAPGLPRRHWSVRRPSDSRQCRSGPAGAIARPGPRSRGQRVAEAGHPSARRRISPPPAGLPSYDLLMREVSEDGWGGRRQDPLAVQLVPSVECSADERNGPPSAQTIRDPEGGAKGAGAVTVLRPTGGARQDDRTRWPCAFRHPWIVPPASYAAARGSPTSEEGKTRAPSFPKPSRRRGEGLAQRKVKLAPPPDTVRTRNMSADRPH